MYLTAQSRMAREKLLRGLDGQYGLRQASSKAFTITQGSGYSSDRLTFNVDPNDWPTPETTDDRLFSVEMDYNHKLWARGSETALRLFKPDVTTDILDLSSSGRTVRALISVTVRAGGKSYTNRQVIQTYLVNP